jgi:transposase
MAIDAHRDLLILQALGGVEDQSRALHIPKRQRRRLRPPLELGTVLSRQLDPITAGPRHDHHFAPPHPPPSHNSTRFRTAPLAIRRSELETRIAEQLPLSPWAQTARRLMCLRGIDTLTAAGLCAEVGDFTRFRHPEQLMSFLGVVPSEHSSGTRRRQGSITKSGSQHARRLLVEAAWHYRQPPRVSEPLRRRQAGADPAIVAISWKTQRRLHRVWSRMESRGKRRTIIAVAAARELAGFCWAVATQ